MPEHVLITGGAGFIGSHVADELLAHGHDVRVLDVLCPQVHGPERRRPAYLVPEVELLVGDVRDREAVRRALRGVTAVYHFAARVGVGQSMYRIEDYTADNGVGTAVLLEALAEAPVRKLVVASSMSVYGEGLYRNRTGDLVTEANRAFADVQKGRWELCDARGYDLLPVPTPEPKPPSLTSVYAPAREAINDPVPLFPYPGSPDYKLRWGAPDDLAWERAVDHYLAEFDGFSDLQDARPLPLAELELAPGALEA